MPLSCPVLPPRFIAPPRTTSDTRLGVLFINLGSPTRPTALAIAAYLREFLSDTRVIELPKIFWACILYGIILPLRARRNIRKYQAVWRQKQNASTPSFSDFGSPLHVYSDQFLQAIRSKIHLPADQINIAMRYGLPSIRETLLSMNQQGVQHIIVVPLYPQYASSTTGTAMNAVYRTIEDFRVLPSIFPWGNAISSFPSSPFYIDALIAQWQKIFSDEGMPETLILSFHGLPLAMIEKGDVYQDHCMETANALRPHVKAMGIDLQVSYQSRFGAQKWLAPSTEETLILLAQQGVKHVAVACPGFTVDCLETLEEINIELREKYLHAGGENFRYLPCLNDNPRWVEGLAEAINRTIDQHTFEKNS